MARQKDFFKVYSNFLLSSVRTFMPAIVLSYDKANMVADVQPSFLMTQDNGKEPVKMGMLQDVPVLMQRFECYEELYTGSGEHDHSHTDTLVTKKYIPVYQPGDVVMLAICDRNIDNLRHGTFLPNSNKKFSVTDAVVIGGWQLS